MSGPARKTMPWARRLLGAVSICRSVSKSHGRIIPSDCVGEEPAWQCNVCGNEHAILLKVAWKHDR